MYGVDNREISLSFTAVVLAPVLFMTMWLITGHGNYAWDAAWYRGIAQFGYRFDGDIRHQQSVAFLPGYPALIALVAHVTGFSVFVAQYWLSLTLFLLGAYGYLGVFARQLGTRRAAVCVLIWTVSPFSIYFLNGYSEIVLFSFSALALRLVDRGKLVPAALVASYAMCARPHGVAVATAVVVGVVLLDSGAARPLGVGRWLLTSTRGVVGIVPLLLVFPAMMTVYWYVAFGDALLYNNAIHPWRIAFNVGSGPIVLAQSVFLNLGELFRGAPTIQMNVRGISIMMVEPKVMSALWMTASLAATTLLILRKEFLLGSFCAAIVIFNLVSSDILNLGRHMASCPAVPFVLAGWMRANAKTTQMWSGSPTEAARAFRIGKSIALLAITAFLVYHYIAYALLFFRGVFV